MPPAKSSNATARWGAFPGAQAVQLPLDDPAAALVPVAVSPGKRALEDEDFPFEALSHIAEAESWRKEINRPTTHIHKWWAQRLGAVFRAMAIAAFAPSGADVLDLFYRPTRIRGKVVFDPFMGSGTTLVEALKLGARGIGRDINPVAYFLVKCALSVHRREDILDAFHAIERDVADKLRGYYRASLPGGGIADVLYYFWVKVVYCPACATPVDLFSSMIFARHAQRKKHSKCQALCPFCGGVNEIRHDDEEARCASCERAFNPHCGPANGRFATCPSCEHRFPIADAARAAKRPPRHRLYAKLALRGDGSKAYLAATEEDRAAYARAERQLRRRAKPYPVVEISPGYNTNQVLGYNYRSWDQMFNARQLLCLSILADRIRQVEAPALRELFTCLFSGALEFNNMFASYKGEGTGAVRPMFAHHILKPERTPLEANAWGTPRSSGSFLTMFEGRIRRALDYADNPFELRVNAGGGGKGAEKIFGLSEKLGFPPAADYRSFREGKRLYLSCGDSSATDLPEHSVDAVLTDPPFFDNVHYSQLADFFHVWQRHILGAEGCRRRDTTRSDDEVQNAAAEDFTKRLAGVWREARRVLKDEGLLAFTYHHSRSEGWRCVLHALMEAGFCITATQPVKSEMSVALPKRQAREPIDLDIIVVCRKREQLAQQGWNGELIRTVTPAATRQARRLADSGRKLSRNDARIIVMAQVMRRLSRMGSVADALHILDNAESDAAALMERLYALQEERTLPEN